MRKLFAAAFAGMAALFIHHQALAEYNLTVTASPALDGFTIKTCDACQASTQSVREIKKPDEQIAAFSTKQGSRITGCGLVILAHAGPHDGNNSYGGLCTLERGGSKIDVEVCYDEMLGRFASREIGGNATGKKELIEFLGNNCYGG